MAAALNEAPRLLMPKATAVWLIENTALTFRQIADFTELTEIEIEALANEDIGRGLVGRNPVDNSELTRDEITRCEADASASLTLRKNELPSVKMRAKGPRYTPVSKRGDKPDAIAYILKHMPDIGDAQICKLVGTTKPTIQAIRDRSHPNSSNLRPRHPAELGLCTYKEFENVYQKALKAAGKDPEAIAAQRAAEEQAALAARDEENKSNDFGMAGFDFSNFLSSDTNKNSSNED